MNSQDKRRHHIIIMTDHATARALQRGVEKKDIQRIIDNPTETVNDSYQETYKSYGKAIDPYSKESIYLIIVHSRFNKHVKIITVMCVNSVRGLKAHGFSNV